MFFSFLTMPLLFAQSIMALLSLFVMLLKIPSKWEHFAHNGNFCFFQHNYIPTFEQWLWDRMCVLSTWFGDICGSRRDFCMFYKRSGPLISNSIRCGCLRTNQCNIACPKAAVNRNALAIDRRPPARRRRIVPCDLRRASLPVPPLFASWYFVIKEVVWYSFASVVHDSPYW